jgi:uncharacterized membrane protein YeaQ/YmgE (transglycosylase-associated protein family)
MSWIDLLLLLVVAGVCGAIGQAIAGYSRGGCLTAIAVGFIGALLGAWISRKLGIGELFAVTIAGTTFPILWSIVGAALFVAVIGLFSRRP